MGKPALPIAPLAGPKAALLLTRAVERTLVGRARFIGNRWASRPEVDLVERLLGS